MQLIFDDVISRVKTAMKGDSVYAFAKKLGISQQTADCYINGKRKPSIDFLYRVVHSMQLQCRLAVRSQRFSSN